MAVASRRAVALARCALVSPPLAFPDRVRIVEVGPRDGLQAESSFVPTKAKVGLIKRLAAAGIPCIDAAAFVHPKWNPNLADGEEVLRACLMDPSIRDTCTLTAIVPNEKGARRAVAAGAVDMSVWLTGSETFSQRNLNMTVEQHIDANERVAAVARESDIPLRGYISNAVDCPFEGRVDPTHVRNLALELQRLGCYELSLADTRGTGDPAAVDALLRQVLRDWPVEHVGLHLHNTYGLALASLTLAMRNHGVATVECSVAGLGGCPYAPGASGNVATEDVLFLCRQLGIETGVDLDAVLDAGEWVCARLGRAGPESAVWKALRGGHRTSALPCPTQR